MNRWSESARRSGCRPAENCDRITRYLLGRGISNAVIQYCIERKILYESAEYHNCVFLGKDPQGVPKYAALRGIYDYGKPFKREAPAVRNSTDSASRQCSPALPWRCLKPP
ncbi:DUF3991 domain-containing protein [Gemmiger formicilis]|nr:DUF3991 domain-containing protein [Gemmiger formicilis]